MQHRIVVKRHRPWFRAGLIAGAAAVIAIAGFGLYAWVRTHTISEFRQTRTELEQLRDERRDLARELRTARSENTDLRQQIVYAQRSTEIDGAACTEVKASLSDLQAEAADLREQVAFYRGIVSPDETRAGVRVLDLKMTQQPDRQHWRYDLVLIQSVRHDKRVAGSAQLRLIGSRDGEQVTQDLAPLLSGDARLPQFAFKYFQEFTGEFRLPPNFRPIRASVTLDIDGEQAAVENEFDWSKIRVELPP
ncbi:MAG: hypothetical protein JWQ90_5383 [Hydrocarboniphaga sp.]|uniref:DUF6776 family protein n=1 Tax=Hydrocarboniphaga sp. TaxID=2033016 RepID=UPI002632F379|nr:DUF6776 family protein [Hydrocarboniphaga sp.]MDB5972933.1 hypothetical protein [Hydrocarboniphaga sp.]